MMDSDNMAPRIRVKEAVLQARGYVRANLNRQNDLSWVHPDR